MYSSSVYIEHIEDNTGDLVDMKIYCNSTCAYTNANANAWPADESDTCVYCANDGCRERAVIGIDCQFCNE